MLTTAGHENAVYELSGDSAWNFGELAAALATCSAGTSSYRSVTPEEHLAILVDAGLDEATAGFVVALDGNIRDGALADATPELARLAGRPTTPLLDAVRTSMAAEASRATTRIAGVMRRGCPWTGGGCGPVGARPPV